jgi:hypothetical protein
MSLAEIAASDWFLVFVIVLGWLVIIIFMATMERRLSRLRTDFKLLFQAVKLLSDEVGHLKVAENRRLMMEVNAGRERADHAHFETSQSSDNRPH